MTRVRRSEADIAAAGVRVVALPRMHTPGLRIEQINKLLGTMPKELAWPIEKLLAEGTIRKQGNGGRRRTSRCRVQVAGWLPTSPAHAGGPAGPTRFGGLVLKATGHDGIVRGGWRSRERAAGFPSLHPSDLRAGQK